MNNAHSRPPMRIERWLMYLQQFDCIQSEVSTRQNQRCRLLIKTRDATVSERQTFCFVQRSHSATTSAQRCAKSSIASRNTDRDGARSTTHETPTTFDKRGQGERQSRLDNITVLSSVRGVEPRRERDLAKIECWIYATKLISES